MALGDTHLRCGVLSHVRNGVLLLLLGSNLQNRTHKLLNDLVHWGGSPIAKSQPIVRTNQVTTRFVPLHLARPRAGQAVLVRLPVPGRSREVESAGLVRLGRTTAGIRQRPFRRSALHRTHGRAYKSRADKPARLVAAVAGPQSVQSSATTHSKTLIYASCTCACDLSRPSNLPTGATQWGTSTQSADKRLRFR